MTDADKEAVLSDLHTRLLNAGAPPILPVIEAIISAIMAIFNSGVCPTPKKTATDHPAVFRFNTRRELHKQGVPFAYMSQSIDAVMTVTTNATDDDVVRCAACAE